MEQPAPEVQVLLPQGLVETEGQIPRRPLRPAIAVFQPPVFTEPMFQTPERAAAAAAAEAVEDDEDYAEYPEYPEEPAEQGGSRRRRRRRGSGSNCSGGTEVGACFLSVTMLAPTKPCSVGFPALGEDVDVFDEQGRPVRGEVGELVCKRA